MERGCGRCGAVHHASCWDQHGGCFACPRPAAPSQGCLTRGCAARPLAGGRCAPHAREHALTLAGVFTLVMGLLALPGALLLVGGVRAPGAILLLCALVAGGARHHYRRLADV